MKKFSCPGCGTRCCHICIGRQCDCEPEDMEIAIYCNCAPTNLLKFMRKRLDLAPHERKRMYIESKKYLKGWLKNLGNIPLSTFKFTEDGIEEEEKPEAESDVDLIDPEVRVSVFDWGDETAAYLKIRYYKHHDDEESQSDTAMDIFLKMLSEHGTVQISLNRDTDDDCDNSHVIIEVRTPKEEESLLDAALREEGKDEEE